VIPGRRGRAPCQDQPRPSPPRRRARRQLDLPGSLAHGTPASAVCMARMRVRQDGCSGVMAAACSPRRRPTARVAAPARRRDLRSSLATVAGLITGLVGKRFLPTAHAWRPQEPQPLAIHHANERPGWETDAPLVRGHGRSQHPRRAERALHVCPTGSPHPGARSATHRRLEPVIAVITGTYAITVTTRTRARHREPCPALRASAPRPAAPYRLPRPARYAAPRLPRSRPAPLIHPRHTPHAAYG